MTVLKQQSNTKLWQALMFQTSPDNTPGLYFIYEYQICIFYFVLRIKTMTKSSKGKLEKKNTFLPLVAKIISIDDKS